MPLSSRGPLPHFENESERTRLAQRLHEGPCQTFSSAALVAEILLRDAKVGTAADESLHQELATMIATGVNELHEILQGLREVGAPPDSSAAPPGSANQGQP